MTLEIKHLQNFSRIADLGSLTRAAGSLGLTQSALSRQVQALEAELKVELFRRNGRGLVLTASGKRLREHAHVILRQVAQAYRSVAEGTDAGLGTVALGLTPSLARSIVLPLIEAYKHELPQTTMRSVDGHSQHLMELVATSKLDCAVVYNPVPADGVVLTPLFEERFYLVSGPMEPPPGVQLKADMQLSDLATLPLITPSKLHSVHLALVEALREFGKEPNVRHEIANLTAVLDLVRNGLGFAVLPVSAVHPCIGDKNTRIHGIHRPSLQCELFAAFPSGSLSDPLLEGSLRVLQRVVPEQIALMRGDVDAVVHP